MLNTSIEKAQRNPLVTVYLVGSAMEMKTGTFHIFILFYFLAVQDSSISDIVCQSVGPLVPWLEPTNNQSLGSIKE